MNKGWILNVLKAEGIQGENQSSAQGLTNRDALKYLSTLFCILITNGYQLINELCLQEFLQKSKVLCIMSITFLYVRKLTL